MAGEEQIENIKEFITITLEESFIDYKDEVEHEMNIINATIDSFSDKKYSYDEYCRCRLKYELEACDTSLNIDFEEESKFTDQEQSIVKNRAQKKHFGNKNADYEEIMKEEYIKWQVEKSFLLDHKMFYNICHYSITKLIQNKLKSEVWDEKVEYFDEIIQEKAKAVASEVAENNKKMHEEQIRKTF